MGIMLNQSFKYGKFSTEKKLYLNGVEDRHFIVFLNKIKKINYYNYDLYLYGGILQDRNTHDVDLLLHGEFEEEKIIKIMDEICRIGFKMGVIPDISYTKELFICATDGNNFYNIFDKKKVLKKTHELYYNCENLLYRGKKMKRNRERCGNLYKMTYEIAPHPKRININSKNPICICRRGLFNVEFLENLKNKTKTKWWEGYYQIGGFYSNQLFYLGGLKDPIVLDFFSKIKKLNYRDYDVYIVGGVVMKESTLDIDLVIHGKKENKDDELFLKSLMEQITKIGFEMNLLCEIYFYDKMPPKGWSQDPKKHTFEFNSYYFTDKIFKINSQGGIKNYNLNFKKEGFLYKKEVNFPYKKTIDYFKKNILQEYILLCDKGKFITPKSA